MAPKAKTAQKPAKRVTGKGKGEEATNDDRKKTSATLTALKMEVKDPLDAEVRAEVLALYQSFGRLGTKKNELLDKWQADKSCKWIHKYVSVIKKSEGEDRDCLVWLGHQGPLHNATQNQKYNVQIKAHGSYERFQCHISTSMKQYLAMLNICPDIYFSFIEANI